MTRQDELRAMGADIEGEVLFIDQDGDACLAPSGRGMNLVALPGRDDDGSLLQPDAWQAMVDRFNAFPTLASDLATALDDLEKARAEVARLREALTAADALSKAAWQHDDAFCIIEDSAQEAARQELEAKLEAYRESRAALTPAQEG